MYIKLCVFGSSPPEIFSNIDALKTWSKPTDYSYESDSSYNLSYESILKLAGRSTINFTRLRSRCNGIFKSLNNINPAFINKRFKFKKTKRAVSNQYKLNLEVPIINQITFGAKSISILDQKFGIHFHFTYSLEKKWDTVS